jgi:hypothetical protein
MRNKTQRLTVIGILFLVIGLSFLVGTIYRSSVTPVGGLGFEPIPFNSTTEHRSTGMPYAFPPRDLSLDITKNHNCTIELYLLDSEGISLWLSEGTLKPVWVAKDVTTQTVSVHIPHRDNYAFLFFTTDNSVDPSIISNMQYKLSGYEHDLLYFSLTAIVVGFIIFVVSQIMLRAQKGNKKSVAQSKQNLDLASEEILLQQQPKRNVDKPTPLNQLRKLFAWEIEEYLAFPIVELVIFIAIFTVLTPTIIEISATRSYSNLLSGIQTIFLFLIFVAAALFCHSYAGSLSKGETKLILSYPVQRSQLFLAKFLALFTVLFAVYAGVFALQIYLLALSPFEPLLYASLLFVALQLLLVCTISTALSVITKNEMLSILVSALLLFGIENIASQIGLVSFTGRFTTAFAFVSQQVRGVLPTVGVLAAPTMGDALLSLFLTIGISSFLFVFSYVYYTHKMEID